MSAMSEISMTIEELRTAANALISAADILQGGHHRCRQQFRHRGVPGLRRSGGLRHRNADAQVPQDLDSKGPAADVVSGIVLLQATPLAAEIVEGIGQFGCRRGVDRPHGATRRTARRGRRARLRQPPHARNCRRLHLAHRA